MISLTTSKIPKWLRKSEFAKTLLENDDEDDEFNVPSDCFKETSEVENAEDFSRVYKTYDFWRLKKLIDYFTDNKEEVYCSLYIKKKNDGSLKHIFRTIKESMGEFNIVIVDDDVNNQCCERIYDFNFSSGNIKVRNEMSLYFGKYVCLFGEILTDGINNEHLIYFKTICDAIRNKTDFEIIAGKELTDLGIHTTFVYNSKKSELVFTDMTSVSTFHITEFNEEDTIRKLENFFNEIEEYIKDKIENFKPKPKSKKGKNRTDDSDTDTVSEEESEDESDSDSD